MGIDLSGFKVIYGEKVLNAVALVQWNMGMVDMSYPPKDCILKPKFLEVLVINEDGNIRLIHDEAWCFQFLPIVQKGIDREYNEVGV